MFDSEDGSYSNHTPSPYTKISQNGTPKTMVDKPQSDNVSNGFVSDTVKVVENPVVHVEEASDDSTSNSKFIITVLLVFIKNIFLHLTF